MCVGVGEALAKERSGKFGDAEDVRDGGDRRHDGEAYKLRVVEEECEEELARDEEDEPAEVRRGEERGEGVAVLGEHRVEAVEREHPRDGALERGAGVVVGRGRAGERLGVAGDSVEDALPERRQLENANAKNAGANWTKAGVTWFSMKNASSCATLGAARNFTRRPEGAGAFVLASGSGSARTLARWGS